VTENEGGAEDINFLGKTWDRLCRSEQVENWLQEESRVVGTFIENEIHEQLEHRSENGRNNSTESAGEKEIPSWWLNKQGIMPSPIAYI